MMRIILRLCFVAVLVFAVFMLYKAYINESITLVSLIGEKYGVFFTLSFFYLLMTGVVSLCHENVVADGQQKAEAKQFQIRSTKIFWSIGQGFLVLCLLLMLIGLSTWIIGISASILLSVFMFWHMERSLAAYIPVQHRVFRRLVLKKPIGLKEVTCAGQE